MIYGIGDSHIDIVKYFVHVKIHHHTTSCTMFNLQDGIKKLVHELDSLIQPGDVFLVSYGEIDLRYRVAQREALGESWKHCIEMMVKRYLNFLHEWSREKQVRVILLLPPPPYPLVGESNPDFPTSGTILQRIGYHQWMTQLLKQSDFEYIDINPIISLHGGTMNSSFADPFHLHLNPVFAPLVETRLLNLLHKDIQCSFYTNAVNYHYDHRIFQ